MSEPTPSEILRPFFDKAGWLVPGSGPQAHDTLLSILDRLDAELCRIAAKVDVDPPASEWPKWSVWSGVLYRRDSEQDCFYLSSDFGHWERSVSPVRGHSEYDITHAEAVSRYPVIAKQYPLPQCKEDHTCKQHSSSSAESLHSCSSSVTSSGSCLGAATTGTAEADGGLEAEAREFAERMLARNNAYGNVPSLWDITGNHPCNIGNIPGLDNDEYLRNARSQLARNLTAFAARAIERHKAHTTAAEGDLAAYLKDAQNDLANARAECERLRSVISEYADKLKMLGDTSAKGAKEAMP